MQFKYIYKEIANYNITKKIYIYNFLLYFHQLFKHIHILIVSGFKLHLLFVIKSVPPENILSTGTLEPININK